MSNTVLSYVMSKMNRHFKKYQPVLLLSIPLVKAQKISKSQSLVTIRNLHF